MVILYLRSQEALNEFRTDDQIRKKIGFLNFYFNIQ